MGTLIIYVVRNLEYRGSIPSMRQEYLLQDWLWNSPRFFFLSSVYKGYCRPGMKRLLRRSEAAPPLPSIPFL